MFVIWKIGLRTTTAEYIWGDLEAKNVVSISIQDTGGVRWKHHLVDDVTDGLSGHFVGLDDAGRVHTKSLQEVKQARAAKVNIRFGIFIEHEID